MSDDKLLAVPEAILSALDASNEVAGHSTIGWRERHAVRVAIDAWRASSPSPAERRTETP